MSDLTISCLFPCKWPAQSLIPPPEVRNQNRQYLVKNLLLPSSRWCQILCISRGGGWRLRHFGFPPYPLAVPSDTGELAPQLIAAACTRPPWPLKFRGTFVPSLSD